MPILCGFRNCRREAVWAVRWVWLVVRWRQALNGAITARLISPRMLAAFNGFETREKVFEPSSQGARRINNLQLAFRSGFRNPLYESQAQWRAPTMMPARTHCGRWGRQTRSLCSDSDPRSATPRKPKGRSIAAGPVGLLALFELLDCSNDGVQVSQRRPITSCAYPTSSQGRFARQDSRHREAVGGGTYAYLCICAERSGLLSVWRRFRLSRKCVSLDLA